MNRGLPEISRVITHELTKTRKGLILKTYRVDGDPLPDRDLTLSSTRDISWPTTFPGLRSGAAAFVAESQQDVRGGRYVRGAVSLKRRLALGRMAPQAHLLLLSQTRAKAVPSRA